MPVSPARAAAFEILMRVERENSYASELLHAARYLRLSAADHGLATELVMGVLRWRPLLDQHIAAVSTQKLSKLDLEILIALRLGVYQMLYLERIPQHAIVHESVELVKRARKQSAAPFANAVLRKLAEVPRTSNPILEIQSAATTAALAQLSAHPLGLVERWVEQFGLATAKAICIYNQTAPTVTIRLRDAGVEHELRSDGLELATGTMVTRARRILRGDVTKTKAFAAGRVAIQDEASQLVALLVGRGQRLLDCCAAPGGKTSILAERNPKAAITAVELHPHRARLLRKLVSADTVRVLAADARDIPLATHFDRVLADVPCSGTGTLARNPEIKWRLKPEDLADLQSRQVPILRSAMSHVTNGGRLIYSTCSLEPEENSEVIEKALAADTASFRLLYCREELNRLREEGELALKDTESLTSGKYLRILPGAHGSDGFFAAILQR
jgi:16S rRNA (cytosine967-C5)-methyltransferase